MHEGIIIVNKIKTRNDTFKVSFCNRPAQKLINDYVGKVEEYYTNFGRLSQIACFKTLLKDAIESKFSQSEPVNLE